MQNSDNTLWCLLCNTFLTSRSKADEHFKGAFHLERVKYLAFMKRNVSQTTAGRAFASDERRPKKIYEVYRTPYDYLQCQRRMTTSEPHASNRMWQRDDEFPGLPSAKNGRGGGGGGEEAGSTKKRNRNRSRGHKKESEQSRNYRSSEIDHQSSKMMAYDGDRPTKKALEIDKTSYYEVGHRIEIEKSSKTMGYGADQPSEIAASSKTMYHRPLEVDRSSSITTHGDEHRLEIDRLSKITTHGDEHHSEVDRQSVVTDNSGLSSPSVWGQNKHNINPSTPSDYWGSGHMDNRPRGNSVSSVGSTWSAGEPHGGTMEPQRDRTPMVNDEVAYRYSADGRSKQEYHQNYRRSGYVAFSPRGGYAPRGRGGDSWSYRPSHRGGGGHLQHVVPQSLQHMQPVQQIVQPVPQLQQMPIQPSQQMQLMQAVLEPLKPVHLRQPVSLMQPVQQHMQPVQQQLQSVQQKMQLVQQQIQLVQQQLNIPPLQPSQAPPPTPIQLLRRPNASSPVKQAAPQSTAVAHKLRDGQQSQRVFTNKQQQRGGIPPSSPVKNSNQSPPVKGQEAVVSKPKNVLGNTYFGGERPRQDVPDDVTSIYVRNEDAYDVPDEDLMKFFAMFGEVKSITKPSKKSQKNNRRPPSIIVTFTHSSAVREAIRKTMFMGGKFTPVNPVPKKGEGFVNPKTEKALGPVDIYDIQDIGRPGLSFDEALDLFKSMMQQDEHLEEKQRAVCRDLEATFQHILPGVKAKLFGSSQVGLRLKDSDTDIFMDCPSGQPQRNFVQKYGGLMYDNKYFEKVVKIATARVPIVTFNHVETGLLCDVTFLNKLGLKNSEMLKFLLSLDPRIRDLALIVKYWAKVHELSGVGNYSNYALTFMVLFYLQQLDEPLVPSVYLLQQLADRKEVCENWECSFCSDVSKLPKITNKSTTKELLSGFFDYWARFDYEKYVACPLLGRIIEKSDFKEFEGLPDELERYKRHAREVEAQLESDKKLESALDKEQKSNIKNRKSKMSWFEKCHALNVDFPVSIQDAFDLSYNITRMIKHSLLVRFQWLCEYARDEVLTKTEESKVLLDVFLPPKVKPPETVSHEFTNQKDVFMDQFHVPGINPNEERYKIVWFIVVRLSVVFILTHVYCIELEMDDSNESKAIMSSENMELTERVYRTVCMKMRGHSMVFEKRTKSKKRLVLGSDAVINESIVSREMLAFLKNSARQRGDLSDKCLVNYTMKIRFFCFPDEARPRLMVQFINCKSANFNAVTAGLNGLFCSSFQRGMTKCMTDNDFPIAEYLKSGGGDWYDFASYFEDFVRDCNEKSKKLSDDPRYAIVLQTVK